MNKIKIILFFSLLFYFGSCSYQKSTQNQIVELPLTIQTGYRTGTGISSIGFLFSNAEVSRLIYSELLKFPEGLTDMQQGAITINYFQTIYQAYWSRDIPREMFDAFQNAWRWQLDTLSLSRKPIRTQIAFVYGRDSVGTLKVVIDANNNLDLSDDKLFTPLIIDRFAISTDSLAQIAKKYSIDVEIDRFVNNEVISTTIPLFVFYDAIVNMLSYSFLEYATTEYNGQQITVLSVSDLSYNIIKVALNHDHIPVLSDIYSQGEYIEIKGEFYKILGANIGNRTLRLERIDSTVEPFSAQIGFKAFPFQGEDFITQSTVSLEQFRGKYVLLSFWGAWCAPCLREIPYLRELYTETDREKFEIIGIASRTPSDALLDVINRYAITWIQISDKENEINEMYNIRSYPSTFLLDKEGRIIARDGFLRGRFLKPTVLSLIDN